MARATVVALDSPAVQATRIDELQHRYAATVIAQILQMASGVVTASVVPRVLGATTYGNYNFLLNMAGAIRGFSEPSVQQAFFTFSSQEDESGALSRIYALWIFIQLALLLGLIAVAAIFGLTGRIWPGQRLDQVVLITSVDWTMFLVLTLKQLGDSKGLTVRPQIVGTIAAILSLGGLMGLAATHHLSFYTYAALNLATAGSTAAALAYWLLVVNGQRCWTGDVTRRAGIYVRKWWVYARPLILVEYYTPLVAFIGMYLVQVWYGSFEQGQFALGSRWSALVLLFTSAAVTIVWREIAAATAVRDHERATHLYYRFNRRLVFMAIVLATWLACASPMLVPLVAGSQYVGAIPVVMVMAFYPLAQTIGQLSTAGLKATGRTVEFRNLALLLSIPDLAFTYLLVAPASARIPGLGLGALGVAIKMTGFALISVQLYERALARHFGVAYGPILRGFIASLTIVVAIGAVTIFILSSVLHSRWHASAITSLGVTSLTYFVASVAIVFAAPRLVGLDRSELTVVPIRWIR